MIVAVVLGQAKLSLAFKSNSVNKKAAWVYQARIECCGNFARWIY